MKIGITGHQELPIEEDWSWVKQSMAKRLQSAAKPLIGFTSLAVGADQLFAKTILEVGGILHAVIPHNHYEKTFDSESKLAFDELLAESASVDTLPGGPDRQEDYLRAGRHIVENVDLLFAVWDGKEAKGKGGTADIVSYARRKSLAIFWMNPIDHTLQEIR